MCPVCKAVVDAEVNVWGDKVFLRKRCRDHGSFDALVYSDAEASMAAIRGQTLPAVRFQEAARHRVRRSAADVQDASGLLDTQDGTVLRDRPDSARIAADAGWQQV